MEDSDHHAFHSLPLEPNFLLEYDLSTPDISFDFLAYPGPGNGHDDEEIDELLELLDESNALGQDNGLEKLLPRDSSQVDTPDVFLDSCHDEDEESTFTEQTNPGTPVIGDIPKSTVTVALPQSTLTQPRSIFQGFIPPAPECQEAEALVTLLEAVKSQESMDDDYIELDLHNFAIYINSDLYPHELRPLHHLATRQKVDRFYFDGIISYGDTKFYLRKVAFRQLPIGNYGSVEHTVGDQIWIRSQLNEDRDREIYYKLGSPSVEYTRFYTPFLWIADLTKHVIDYCEYLKGKDRRASIHDFQSRFGTWILQRHGKSATFKVWYSTNQGSDFRGAIVANAEYMWKEAHGLDPKITSWHRVWKEIWTFEQYKPHLVVPQDLPLSPSEYEAEAVRHGIRKSRKPEPVPKTVVTPYIYDLFAHTNFGKVLQKNELSANAKRKQSAFLQRTAPIKHNSSGTAKRDRPDKNSREFIESIQPGDVISTKPDDEETDTQWKKETSKHYQGEYLWFGRVQKVHHSPKDNKYCFDVIWLYQPIDTPCAVMKYPWRNELFLSDNCTCHHGTGKIQGNQILSTHEVEWFGGPSTSAEFFVRQTYVARNSQWTILKDEHFDCGGPHRKSSSYNIGDAVLVQTNPEELKLETCIVESFVEEGTKKYARLWRLQCRREVDKAAVNSPPNELVFSQQLIEISPKRIARRCLVRTFRLDEEIPAPYNRGGTGDAFFVTHQEVHTDTGSVTFVPLAEDCLEMLRQGFNPNSTQIPKSQKLQGLDLFCGGGNFGRGLEEGGGIQMRWANDISSEAIHTYMANCKPNSCTPLLGSVDDLLHRAIQGDTKIPQPGEVHFISGGSPCPGFSLLTNDRTTDKQRKNRSLVASFASFIDLYRPHYGILENVPTMVNSKKFRDSCVFSQLVCAVVGLGYQVQIMRLDAWSFGASQSRSRLFLCFSASGFRMPTVPEPSHSHPPNTTFQTLGLTSCGRPFDARTIVPTPFKFVSAREAVGDLPDIQDGKADYCIGYPDHRLSIGYTPRMRKQIRQIPTRPYGMSFSKAWWGRPGQPRVMTASERELFPADNPAVRSERTARNSKGWGRVHPGEVFGTVATICVPADSRVGCANHWQQHRPMTLLEARRAQGYPDEEVLLGRVAGQFRIVGNSVARQVALVLGLAIREAWLGTLRDEPPVPQTGIAAEETGTRIGLESRELKIEDGDDASITMDEEEEEKEEGKLEGAQEERSSMTSSDDCPFGESTFTPREHSTSASATLTPATTTTTTITTTTTAAAITSGIPSDQQSRKRPPTAVEPFTKRTRHYYADDSAKKREQNGDTPPPSG